MILKRGDLWNSGANVIVVTGCAWIRRDGCLVMGRGAALEAQQRFPGCNKVFGQMLRDYRQNNSAQTPYGVFVHPKLKNPELGLFQVKWHYLDEADPQLIVSSAETLCWLCRGHWFGKKVAMNFPGIGFGRLDRNKVLDMISEALPADVEVWEYPA